MFDFDDASKNSSEAMEEMLKSYSAVVDGFQAIAAEASDYSRRSFDDTAAFMGTLMSARAPEEVYKLQAAFMKSSYDTFVAEASKFADLYANLAKSAVKPEAQPVSNPSTSVVVADAAA